VTTHGLAKEKELEEDVSANQRDHVKLANASKETVANVTDVLQPIYKMKIQQRSVFIDNMDGLDVDCQTKRILCLFASVHVLHSLVTMLEDSKSTFASALDSQNKNATRKLDIASVSTRRLKKFHSKVNSASWD